MREKLSISKIKSNPKNPRIIKNKKFEKLVKSIQELPTYMELRPIIIDENYMILGGNMRLKACTHLGRRKVWTDMFTKQMAEQNNIEAEKNNLPLKTYKEYCDEIIIKDNNHNGEWDWDSLGNEWDSVLLDEWGVDVWQQPKEIDYSILDEEDFEDKLDKMEGDVRKALQIPFEAEDYEKAKKIYTYWKDSGAYVGGMILEFLTNEKNKNEKN